MAGLLNSATYRWNMNPECGYNKIFAHVIEMRDRTGLRATEIDHIRELVEDRLWGWHFEKLPTGRVVKPVSNSAKRRQPTSMLNHYLCVSFEDQTDLVQVRFSVFGC